MHIQSHEDVKYELRIGLLNLGYILHWQSHLSFKSISGTISIKTARQNVSQMLGEKMTEYYAGIKLDTPTDCDKCKDLQQEQYYGCRYNYAHHDKV